MKKLIFGLFIIVTVHQTAFSQSGWFQLNSGTTNIFLSSVFFINQTTGYVSGYTNYQEFYSLILKTTNGGIDWTNWTFDTCLFNSIYCLNADTVFAFGPTSVDGIIYRTMNGGTSWDYRLVNGQMWSGMFVSNTTGFAAGKYGFFTKTTDCGNSWNSNNINNAGQISSIFFIDEQTGYVGTYNSILKTTNSGINWNTSFQTGSSFWSIYFINQNTGYACGYEGIFKTTTAGNNWDTLMIGLTPNYFSLFFTSANTGYVTGSSGILKTTNGGLNFLAQYESFYGNSIFFANSFTGYAVGGGSLILKTTTGGEPIGIRKISFSSPGTFTLSQNYPNPFNPTTKIKFDIPKGAKGMDVRLTIYNILGGEVVTLVNEQLKPGSYEVEWNASNFSSGLYFYRLYKDGNIIDTKKMILLK